MNWRSYRDGRNLIRDVPDVIFLATNRQPALGGYGTNKTTEVTALGQMTHLGATDASQASIDRYSIWQPGNVSRLDIQPAGSRSVQLEEK
jgi:hypothetical protein